VDVELEEDEDAEVLRGTSTIGSRKLRTGSSSLSVGCFATAPTKIASTCSGVG
jgi:hypothetical protein